MNQVIFSKIRSIVSADRHRFKSKEMDLDLDLSYITDNILAMGFPGTGFEASWRNSIDDVCELLKQKHHGKYMIWNLSERVYDYSKLNNQILEFPFLDHHPPPLSLLFEIVNSLSNWLKADSENVAVVHCKGGKGRTGTIICCYLYYSCQFEMMEDAKKHFAEKRSKVKKGVTQPSQQRYINYFKEIVSGSHMVEEFMLTFRSIEFGPLTKDQANSLSFEIYEHAKEPILYFASSSNTMQIVPINNESSGDNSEVNEDGSENVQLYKIILLVQKKVSNDVLIRCYKGDTNKGKSKGKMKKQVFHLIFNIAFVNLDQCVFGMKEFDHFKNSKKYNPNLQMECRFQNNCTGLPDHSFKIWNIMALQYQRTKTALNGSFNNSISEINNSGNSTTTTTTTTTSDQNTPVITNKNSNTLSLNLDSIEGSSIISSDLNISNLDLKDNRNRSSSSNSTSSSNITTGSTTSEDEVNIKQQNCNSIENNICNNSIETNDNNDNNDSVEIIKEDDSPIRKRKDTLWTSKLQIKPSLHLSRRIATLNGGSHRALKTKEIIKVEEEEVNKLDSTSTSKENIENNNNNNDNENLPPKHVEIKQD